MKHWCCLPRRQTHKLSDVDMTIIALFHPGYHDKNEYDIDAFHDDVEIDLIRR